MNRTKVFMSGNSQAVRIPKEFRFDSTEVEVFRRGNEIILREPPKGLSRALEILWSLPDDFMADWVPDGPPQEREWPW